MGPVGPAVMGDQNYTTLSRVVVPSGNARTVGLVLTGMESRVGRARKSDQPSVPRPRQARTVPGLFLILAELPPDLRDELEGPEMRPEQAYFFALGYLRCVRERASFAEPGPAPPLSVVQRPAHLSPVTRVMDTGADPAAMLRHRPVEIERAGVSPDQRPESPIVAPESAYEAIGHWSSKIVGEVVGFAVVNTQPEHRDTAVQIAVGWLKKWDPGCQDLPGSWAAVILASLAPADGRSIRRELKPKPTPFDGNMAGAGNMESLMAVMPGGSEGGTGGQG